MRLKDLRNKLSEAKRAISVVDRALSDKTTAVEKTKKSLSKSAESKALVRLAEIPIENLREASDSSIRIETLRKYGFTNVASVYHASEGQLERLNGITREGAIEIKSIASAMYEQIAQNVDVRIDVNSSDKDQTELLENLQEVESLESSLRGKEEKLKDLSLVLRNSMALTGPINSRIKWFFTKKIGKERAINAVSNIGMILNDPVTGGLILTAEKAFSALQEARSKSATEEFKKRSSDYYSILDEIAGRSSAFGQSDLDSEIISRIESQELDTSDVNAVLRRYQVFGSKFALTQRRVILGDEMGLGKTLQAITVITQQHARGLTRTLVICPASVIVNWQREFESRSSLKPIKIHGQSQKEALASWISGNGVAITTFDTLKTIPLNDDEIQQLQIQTIVVDEAHYVKNIGTGRTATISKWLKNVPTVMFMTGTPLENRVSEFINLARLLDADFAGKLNRFALAAGAETFRKHVAPIYLRRNSVDVLKELPDLIETVEYCDWTGADLSFYEASVIAGNFMGMRRAAYREISTGVIPSKLERLGEICAESFESGQKVVIFSFFREVLEAVINHLGNKTLQPITGSTSPTQRQSLVDEFRESEKPLALVGQIQAAGTGLNIQAASVVILCEPQIKPSLETQAIARARRMGQINNVHVHRLIIPDSVDTLMIEMLARKQSEFDEFVRTSHLADSVDSAKDSLEESLAKVIVMKERERLGIDPRTSN